MGLDEASLSTEVAVSLETHTDMSAPSGAATTRVRRHLSFDRDDERSPLLPNHAQLKKFARRTSSSSSSASWVDFLKWHAFAPLPDYDPSSSLPAVYVPPMLLQCMISGLADASTFSITRCWVGFMSGNMVQMVINSFDWLLPSDSNADSSGDAKVKLSSNVGALLGFIFGCQITTILIKRVSSDRTTRLTIVLLSLYRCLATLAVILLGIKYSEFRLNGSLRWLVNAVLAASFGCQSTYSTNLATPFANTVVFTATLTAVSSDLSLPVLRLDSLNRLKFLSIVALLGGGALSQTILKVATKASQRDKHEAIQHALFVLSGMELLLGLSWYVCGIAESWKQYQQRTESSTPDDSDQED